MLTFGILEKGLESDFERVLAFLKQLEIFKDQELSILLPLTNAVQWRRYNLGEFILREG